jgi:hypothetical protein
MGNRPIILSVRRTKIQNQPFIQSVPRNSELTCSAFWLTHFPLLRRRRRAVVCGSTLSGTLCICPERDSNSRFQLPIFLNIVYVLRQRDYFTSELFKFTETRKVAVADTLILSEGLSSVKNNGTNYMEQSHSKTFSRSPIFYWNGRFVIIFRTHHWTLTSPWSIRYKSSCHIFLCSSSTCILASHLRASIPSYIFPSGVPTKMLHNFSLMHAHSPWFNCPNNFRGRIQVMCSSSWEHNFSRLPLCWLQMSSLVTCFYTLSV